jgi:adiponectin receptor
MQTRFPEVWRPGKFDIWGASHQIFHVLVVLSAAVHLYGIFGAFRWNYENLRFRTLRSRCFSVSGRLG